MWVRPPYQLEPVCQENTRPAAPIYHPSWPCGRSPTTPHPVRPAVAPVLAPEKSRKQSHPKKKNSTTAPTHPEPRAPTHPIILTASNWSPPRQKFPNRHYSRANTPTIPTTALPPPQTLHKHSHSTPLSLTIHKTHTSTPESFASPKPLLLPIFQHFFFLLSAGLTKKKKY